MVQGEHMREEDLMEWQERRFPANRSMGELELPEAYRCIHSLLPHLHQDMEDRFPKAQSGEA